MPSWVVHHADRIPLHPSAGIIWPSLLVLTLGAFAVTALSSRGGKQSIWSYLLFGYIAAMLLNVFVPHLPAMLVFRAYTPGVVTAVLINLPCMSILLRQAFVEGWVAGPRALAYAVLVPAGIAGAIIIVFRLT